MEKLCGAPLQPSVYRGIMLATGAMILRNGLIVIVLASQAATACAIPLTLMLLASERKIAPLRWLRVVLSSWIGAAADIGRADGLPKPT